MGSKNSRKMKRLEMTVAAVQRRWGPKALRRLGASVTTAEIPHIPTGFPALDQALGIGGIPRGRITEILGAPTSGMATLALRVIANAQADGDTATCVDLGHTFDPNYAARCGVEPARLLLVRPHTGREGLEIAHDLVASGGTGVLVFDSVSHLLGESHGARVMSGALRRLTGPLAGSPCALIFLTPLYFGDAASVDNYPSGFALPHYAAVRLLIEKERWIQRRRDVRGYQARVTEFGAGSPRLLAVGGMRRLLLLRFVKYEHLCYDVLMPGTECVVVKVLRPTKRKAEWLEQTADAFRQAVQLGLDAAHAGQTGSRARLHKLVYHEARESFDLPADYARMVVNTTVSMARAYYGMRQSQHFRSVSFPRVNGRQGIGLGVNAYKVVQSDDRWVLRLSTGQRGRYIMAISDCGLTFAQILA